MTGKCETTEHALYLSHTQLHNAKKERKNFELYIKYLLFEMLNFRIFRILFFNVWWFTNFCSWVEGMSRNWPFYRGWVQMKAGDMVYSERSYQLNHLGVLLPRSNASQRHVSIEQCFNKNAQTYLPTLHNSQ